MTRRPVFVLLFLCFSIPAMAAGGGPPKARTDNASLAAYLRRVRMPPPDAPPPLGSIWVDHGPLSFAGADVQALRVGDLITIHVVENTTAVGSGSVQAKRDFSAQSGLLQMFGQIGPRSGLSNLFGPSSNQAPGQAVGIKEVNDDIWLVTFLDYDLGYFDLETRVLEPLENPFGPKLLPM